MKLYFIPLILFVLLFQSVDADIKKKETIQAPKGIFDEQSNSESNVRFTTNNTGILFLGQDNKGSAFWPKTATNQYMFGGGVWFAAQKWNSTRTLLNKLCSMTYDPNSGSSWMVPGRIEDADVMLTDDSWKYKVYLSTDYRTDGRAKSPLDKYSWPLWNTGNGLNLGMGNFVYDKDNRSSDTYPEGVFFKSDEDIFVTFKDTDLSVYQDTFNIREAQGYPLGLQYEQTILTWEDAPYKDIVIIFYKVINMSEDTLINCFAAPIYDPDLASTLNLSEGATNDRVKFYSEDMDLSLGIQWTMSDRGEAGRGFGYLGISFLLTPAVDGDGRLLPAADYYDKGNQIGLITFRNWSIAEDITEDSVRYDFLSSGDIDAGLIPGDRRMAFASGPFDFYPGDTVFFATQLTFAEPSLGGVATGEVEDVEGLVDKVKAGHDFFYEQVLSKFDSFSDSEKLLQIYPNPAKDEVYINHDFKDKFTISVKNILGREVFKLHSNSNEILKLDISNLNSGNYIICLSNDNVVISKRLIIVK